MLDPRARWLLVAGASALWLASGCSQEAAPPDLAELAADAAGPDLGMTAIDIGDAAGQEMALAETAETEADATLPPPLDAQDGVAQGPPPVVDKGPPVAFANGCAIPQPAASSAGCKGKVCPPQTACMGDGLCLPEAPFPLATNEVHVTRVDLAAAGTEWAAVYGVSTSYASGFDHRLAVKFFAGADTAGSKPLVAWETNASLATWPHIHALGEGHWLVGWTAYAWNAFTSTLRVRHVTSDGAMGPVVQVSQPGMAQAWLGNMLKPHFLTIPVGGPVAVVWTASFPADKNAVWLQRITRMGEPDGNPQKLSDVGVPSWDPACTALTDGALVAWTSWPTKLSSATVRAVRLDSNFNPVGPTFGLPTLGLPHELLPSMVAFSDGSVALTRGLTKSMTVPAPVDYGLVLLTGDGLKQSGGALFVGKDTLSHREWAPMTAHWPGRAVVVFDQQASVGKGIWLWRYYRNEHALDCEPTPVVLFGATGTSKQGYLPSVVAFPDGRILVAWSASAGPVGTYTSTSKAMLRFLPQ